MSDMAMLIRARKFANQMPILVRMERDVNYDEEKICARVEEFFEDKSLSQKIIKWVKYLYSTGQRVKDWDINYLLWTEVEDSTQLAFPTASSEDLITTQMNIDSIKIHQYSKKYDEMYGEEK